MSKLKRITISFNEKDTDLVNFFSRQQNASLSIRLICKNWITEYGTGDVADLLATKSSTSDPDISDQNNAPQNNQSINPVLIDDDIDDDFDDL